jgi:hypothetical protein
VVSNRTQGMDVSCVYTFFCVCVQVEALRRADHPQRSPTECVRSRKTEVNGEVHGSRPRPTGAVVPRKKELLSNSCTLVDKVSVCANGIPFISHEYSKS